MKFVASNSAHVRKQPDIHSDKLLTYYKGQILHDVGQDIVDEEGLAWTPISGGWIYFACLNDYIEESPLIVRVPDILKTLGGVEQYIVWEGAVKTNLCGEFCIAYLANSPIEYFLSKWKEKYPAEYKSAVTQNKPTGLASLRTMLKIYNLEHQDLATCLTDKVLGFFYSPERFQNILEQGWKLICGVKIGNDGKLNTGSIGHWVVLDSVEPLRNGDGLVTIYNPHPNRMQKYSYAELIRAMVNPTNGSMMGLWVKV